MTSKKFIAQKLKEIKENYKWLDKNAFELILTETITEAQKEAVESVRVKEKKGLSKGEYYKTFNSAVEEQQKLIDKYFNGKENINS